MESKFRTELESKSNPELVPISPDFKGPFKWSRRPAIAQNWRKFKPIILSSERGDHAIVFPCGEDWWEHRRRANIHSAGYEVRIAGGDYIIQGSQIQIQSENTKQLPEYNRTVVVTRKGDEGIFAEFCNENSLLKFYDGTQYRVAFRFWVPFKDVTRFEFSDQAGVLQFHINKNWDIWIEAKAHMKYILLLIVIERYLVDLNNAEAPGG